MGGQSNRGFAMMTYKKRLDEGFLNIRINLFNTAVPKVSLINGTKHMNLLRTGMRCLHLAAA
jgi:hypothetical protein